MSTLAPLRAAAALPRWVAPVAVGAAALIGTATVGLMDPEVRGHLTPVCPFRGITGLDCPGCGGTRALYALTQGDVALALNHNLLAVVGLPLLALAWLGWLLYRLDLRPTPVTVRPVTGYAIAVVVIGFWLVRNLPWMPFAWLGSGAV